MQNRANYLASRRIPIGSACDQSTEVSVDNAQNPYGYQILCAVLSTLCGVGVLKPVYACVKSQFMKLPLRKKNGVKIMYTERRRQKKKYRAAPA